MVRKYQVDLDVRQLPLRTSEYIGIQDNSGNHKISHIFQSGQLEFRRNLDKPRAALTDPERVYGFESLEHVEVQNIHTPAGLTSLTIGWGV